IAGNVLVYSLLELQFRSSTPYRPARRALADGGQFCVVLGETRVSRGSFSCQARRMGIPGTAPWTRLVPSWLHRNPRRPGGVLLHAGEEGPAPVVFQDFDVPGGDGGREVFAGAVPVPAGQAGDADHEMGRTQPAFRRPGVLEERRFGDRSVEIVEQRPE